MYLLCYERCFLSRSGKFMTEITICTSLYIELDIRSQIGLLVNRIHAYSNKILSQFTSRMNNVAKLSQTVVKNPFSGLFQLYCPKFRCDVL